MLGERLLRTNYTAKWKGKKLEDWPLDRVGLTCSCHGIKNLLDGDLLRMKLVHHHDALETPFHGKPVIHTNEERFILWGFFHTSGSKKALEFMASPCLHMGSLPAMRAHLRATGMIFPTGNFLKTRRYSLTFTSTNMSFILRRCWQRSR